MKFNMIFPYFAISSPDKSGFSTYSKFYGSIKMLKSTTLPLPLPRGALLIPFLGGVRGGFVLFQNITKNLLHQNPSFSYIKLRSESILFVQPP
jgi:hypothetical protein